MSEIATAVRVLVVVFCGVMPCMQGVAAVVMASSSETLVITRKSTRPHSPEDAAPACKPLLPLFVSFVNSRTCRPTVCGVSMVTNFSN
jgi:hypothetical protein